MWFVGLMFISLVIAGIQFEGLFVKHGDWLMLVLNKK